MTDRAELLNRFIGGTRWAGAIRRPLAGDASARRYERCTLPRTGASCVLMDAPPEHGESVRPFTGIARHLGQSGFSAPEILAEDTENGFLLIEDFGDSVFARMIETDPGCEETLYASAVDVLVEMHSAAVPGGLVSFTPALMAEQAALVFGTYSESEEEFAAFRDVLETILDQNVAREQVLILRDYHAENLIWLPRRDGVRRVGLLDFQDAMAGPVGYDLVSLIHDARRDVSPDLADGMVARFAGSLGLEEVSFAASRAVLCAQRSLRILGVFARLARQGGKTGYVDLIPRVCGHLAGAMQHPVLQPLAPFVATLPPPTPDHLNRLRMPCTPTCR